MFPFAQLAIFSSSFCSSKNIFHANIMGILVKNIFSSEEAWKLLSGMHGEFVSSAGNPNTGLRQRSATADQRHTVSPSPRGTFAAWEAAKGIRPKAEVREDRASGSERVIGPG
jgi:hypothetical protein